MAAEYDFGLVGLGVMGRNFILNVADHGFSALGLDTDPAKVSALGDEGQGKPVAGTTDKGEFVRGLKSPRKIMLLVPAGHPVDAVIDDLLPLLEAGDLIIDGGNSFFRDTDRRYDSLKEKGIRFMGAGVSGGAKGARFGPSIMPGGDQESYELVRPVFEAAAARVEGEPCVDFMGKGSAGNYVKMVHNGIEYALMQLISEVYQLMNDGMQLSNMEMAETFANWNEGRLRSFLVEITAEIFTKPDEFQEGELVDYILDKAKQKGTGKWTSQNAMDLGVAVPSLDAAVSMRQLSSMKEVRIKAEALYPRTKTGMTERISLHDLENALYFGYIISYAQGMTQLAVASEEYTYGVSMERIAKIWRGGCIIRAALLEDMRAAYDRQPDLQSLLLDAAICQKLMDCVPSARRVIRYAIELEVPTLSLSACLNYFDAFRSGRLPLNLIQAQRDHFGSHTYERTDRPGIFHTEW